MDPRLYNQVITTTAVIPNGAAALSAAIDLSAARLVMIEMPATWVAANLTFAASSTLAGTYTPLYDQYGTEYTVTASTSRSIVVALADFVGVRYLKIRSGPVASPVNQTADRTLTLTLLPL